MTVVEYLNFRGEPGRKEGWSWERTILVALSLPVHCGLVLMSGSCPTLNSLPPCLAPTMSVGMQGSPGGGLGVLRALQQAGRGMGAGVPQDSIRVLPLLLAG